MAERDGVTIRIADIAAVSLGHEEASEIGFFLGKPAVGAEVFIFRQELVSDQEAFREAGRIERWSDRLKPERLAGTADANGRVSAKLPRTSMSNS